MMSRRSSQVSKASFRLANIDTVTPIPEVNSRLDTDTVIADDDYLNHGSKAEINVIDYTVRNLDAHISGELTRNSPGMIP